MFPYRYFHICIQIDTYHQSITFYEFLLPNIEPKAVVDIGIKKHETCVVYPYLRTR